MNLGINTSLFNQNIISEQRYANAVEILKNLAVGEEFSGKVLSVVGNDVSISLNNGSIINATMTDSFSFNIGDMINFEVKDNSGQQIVIRPEANVNSEFALIDKALENAKIPPFPRNVELVKELVNQNMPIDKETISYLSKQLAKFPDAPVATIVSLKHMGMEINSANISQFNNYSNYEHSIKDGISTMLNDFINTDNPQIRELFINTFSTSDNMPKLGDILSQETRQMIAMLLNNDEGLAKTVNDGSINIKDFLLKTSQFPEFKEFTKLSHTDGYKQVLKEFMRNELLISPEKLKEEDELNKFYNRVHDNLSKLEEQLNKLGDSKMLNSVNDLKSNITFLNDINHFMTYVQLPLKLSQQEAHGDLYVYANKKNLKNADTLTALLHLDMDNMGALDVFISLQNDNLSTNFRLANEEILDFIEQHMHILNERLTKLGYKVDIKTQVVENTDEKPENIFKESISKVTNMPSVTTTRYSFDIKA